MKSMHLTTTRLLGFLVLAALTFVALPTFSHAATYAYVNTTGEVRTVEAATWSLAIDTAPGIAMHSGVILVDGSDDTALVGDRVSGS